MGVAAIIMAGGRGERFWPASRADRPKQFLAFHGGRTLLQQTVDRLAGLVETKNLWIITREDYAHLVYQQVPEVPRSRVLLEPEGRDTAPCIALATLHVARTNPDAVTVVLPADHLVVQEERFREALRAAAELASRGDRLVTLGIRPTRPETAYGYIEIGPPVEASGAYQAYSVRGFTEKPPRERAIAYLQRGGFYWNSGIFVWRVSAILSALREHMPGLMARLEPLARAIGTEQEAEELRRIYPTLPRLSIDYGVMERARNTLMIPADFGWDDLGTWAALERVLPADEDGNVLSGRVLAVDTRGSVVQGHGERLVATFGVSDLVVVDSRDAVLIADKHRVGELKAVVGRMEAEGLRDHLLTAPRSETDRAGQWG